MKMVKELDPEGVISRRKHKLRRRVYKNKVLLLHFIV